MHVTSDGTGERARLQRVTAEIDGSAPALSLRRGPWAVRAVGGRRSLLVQWLGCCRRPL